MLFPADWCIRLLLPALFAAMTASTVFDHKKQRLMKPARWDAHALISWLATMLVSHE
jgi:hypothetical protein